MHDKRTCTPPPCQLLGRVARSTEASCRSLLDAQIGNCRENTFIHLDTPEGCRLGMPPDSTKVSRLPRALLPKKPRARAPLRREPRENFGLSRHLQTRFHRIGHVVVLHTLHAEILLPPAPLPLPNPPKSQPFLGAPPRRETASRAPLRREPPRKIGPFARLQTRFHRARQVLCSCIPCTLKTCVLPAATYSNSPVRARPPRSRRGRGRASPRTRKFWPFTHLRCHRDFRRLNFSATDRYTSHNLIDRAPTWAKAHPAALVRGNHHGLVIQPSMTERRSV